MSQTVTIPSCMNPFEVTINNHTYSFKSGESVELPDEVAEVINHHVDSVPKPLEKEEEVPGGGSSIDIQPLNVTENGTYIAPEGTAYSPVEVNVASSCGGENKLIQILNKTVVELTEEDLRGTTNIGKYAFDECSSLEKVMIPSTVTYIGERAFNNVSNLKEVHIKDAVSWAGINFSSSYSNPLQQYAKGKLYLNGELISGDLVIPGTVTSIGQYSFHGCTGITNLTIENGVTTIGTCAFSGCTKITKVIIPPTLTTFNTGAFTGCSGIKEVHISNLPNWAFSTFSSNGVLNFSNPLYYKKGQLYLNGELVSGDIELPESGTGIGELAFCGCGITSINIPSTATRINYGAFYDCKNLKTVSFAENGVLERIGTYSFLNIGATDIVIPNSVKYIENYAFQNSSLVNVTIGSGVKTIGAWAFSCYSLQHIKILATTPPTIQSDSFQNMPSGYVIEVPAASVDAYKSATNWSKLNIVASEEF